MNMTDDQMDEIKRHFNVVAEGLHHEIKLIAEGHTTIERVVTEHRVETRQDKRELQLMIQTVHDSLDAKINGVEQRLDTKINSAENGLKTEIRSAGEKVDSHEPRISVLEKKVA